MIKRRTLRTDAHVKNVSFFVMQKPSHEDRL